MELQLEQFPDHFMKYKWNAKHKLFGYPPDSYPDFLWMKSLEGRFGWFLLNSRIERTSSPYLIREMIEWGGSQNGVLQKFNNNMGEVNLYQAIQDIIVVIDQPEVAIKKSLKLPGLGLTYSSKLLRFMKPQVYGALDSRIRKKLFEIGRLRKIYDGNESSMTNGYLDILKLLASLKEQLEKLSIEKPQCSLDDGRLWSAADLEMALFSWAEST